jgi:hypothetical protein
MENIEDFEDEGAGLSDRDIQSVARRQLIGSIVVVVIIAAVASIMMVRPFHLDTVYMGSHKFAAVQQPSFVAPPGQHVAGVVRHEIELP